MSQPVMVAVLGAGAGARMGGGKLDRDLGGRPLGAWALATAQSLGAMVCFISADRQPGWVEPDVEVVHNPHAASGMASSLRFAVDRAQGCDAARLLIMLADMPFVEAATLRMLLDRTAEDTVTACSYPNGRLGPPACFGAGRMASLAALTGDVGARHLLNQPGFALALSIDAAELPDIDTPEDLRLARLRAASRMAGMPPSGH
jgi:molybdenum cofactor cytidylyltransferase